MDKRGLACLKRDQGYGKPVPNGREAKDGSFFSLSVGTVLEAAIGKYQGKLTGENSQLRTLYEVLAEGDVILADRYFIRVRVTQKGFRTKSLVVVTTLLDAEQYPPEEIAVLCRQSWQAELNPRSLKTVLATEHLSARPPMAPPPTGDKATCESTQERGA